MTRKTIEELPEHLEHIEELAQIGSFEVDLVDKTWTLSRNFCKMFNLDFSERFLCEDLKSCIHPDYWPLIDKKFQDCVNTGQKQIFYIISYDADKKPLLIECRAMLNQGLGSPKLQGTMQIVSDNQSDGGHAKELIQLNKAKDELLTTVAHDLKSPINRIKGIVNLLKMGMDKSSEEEYLNWIEDSCKTASNIISDLLELAEINDPEYSLDKSVVDINKLVNASVENHKFSALEKDISIQCALAEEAFAMVQPNKIMRMLDNLLSNAIKFTSSGGRIEIETRKENGKIVIRVEDSGIGIQQDMLPYIFNRFSIARRPGTTGEKSSGLGLNIVKSIVDLHKGKIRVKTHPGKGSQFIVELASL